MNESLQRTSIKRKAITTISLLVLANLLIWAVALATFHHFALLLGTAALAYTFGLRHALDADHISAIDNVTRKLMQDGQRPKGWTLDRDPFLLETNVPGIFAVGDVRHGSIKRVASGVGEGSVAVQFIHQYLSKV